MKKIAFWTAPVLIVLVAGIWVESAWSRNGQTSSSTGFSYSASYTPMYQFETDMENGGRFNIHHQALQLGFLRPLNQKIRMGMGLRYHLTKWDFDEQSTVFGADPWNTVHRVGFNFPIFYADTDKWMWGFIPAVEFSGESGAETGESLSFGGVVSLSHPFGPHLYLGLGFGVFFQPEDTTLFPFIAVDWKISPQFRLANPFHAGPAGPAGLELVYATAQDWELGLGGAYRTHRFRLDEENRIPAGICENEYVVSFLRVQRKLARGFQLDLVGGMLFDGRLTVENANGDEIASDRYDAAPFIALSLAGKF